MGFEAERKRLFTPKTYEDIVGETVNDDVVRIIDQHIVELRKAAEYRPTAVAVFLTPKGEVLLVKSSKSTIDEEYWSLPQGGIEISDLNVIEGLKRELLEELRMLSSEVEVVDFLGSIPVNSDRPRDGYTKGKEYIVFLCLYRGNGKFVFDESTVDAKWFSREKFIEKTSNSSRDKIHFLLALLEKLDSITANPDGMRTSEIREKN